VTSTILYQEVGKSCGSLHNQNFCLFFAECDDSNGDGGDDEDGSNTSDRAGDAGGSRLVVVYRWRQKLMSLDLLLYRKGAKSKIVLQVGLQKYSFGLLVI
jgi:hypothetical protein